MRLAILLLALGVASLAQAATDWGAYKQLGAVSDYAKVLGDKERLSLELLLKELRTQYQVELGVVTVPSLERYDIADMTKYLYEMWNMGRDSANQSALMLLSTGEGELHLYVGMGLRGILTSRWTDVFAERMGNLVGQKQYERAVIGSVTAMVRRVYAQADKLPRRSTRLIEKVGALQTFAAGKAGSVAALAALVLGGVLLFSTVLGAGRHTSAYEMGRDFERGRTGPFGNKKPRWL